MEPAPAKTQAAGFGRPTGDPVPEWVTPQLLAQTLRVWQPYYDEPLTEADALAIVCNVAGLLDALEDTP